MGVSGAKRYGRPAERIGIDCAACGLVDGPHGGRVARARVWVDPADIAAQRRGVLYASATGPQLHEHLPGADPALMYRAPERVEDGGEA